MNAPAVSVVVVTWNGLAHLRANLPAVLESLRRAPGSWEVIVADDASTDGTVEWVRGNLVGDGLQAGPGVRIAQPPEHGGFIAAANAGVAAAAGRIVVLLNNDARPEPDFLAPLPAHFGDPAVFAVSCRQMPGGGLCAGRFHMGFLRVRWNDRGTSAAPTLYADGGAAAFDVAKWRALGGLDLMYSPGYGEDLDLSYRAWKRGWRVAYEPASVVHHARGGTFPSIYSRDDLRRITLRNRLLFMWANASDAGAVAGHLASLSLRKLGAAVTGDRIFFGALMDAVARSPQAFARRSADRPAWTRSDAAVLALSRGDA